MGPELRAWRRDSNIVFGARVTPMWGIRRYASYRLVGLRALGFSFETLPSSLSSILTFPLFLFLFFFFLFSPTFSLFSSLVSVWLLTVGCF